MLKFSLVASILWFSTQALAGDLCPAQPVQEFLKEQQDINMSYGAYAHFDYTEIPLCTAGRVHCEKQILSDSGAEGYYEPHDVFYVTCDDMVIFASTSEYSEQTYGSQLGSPIAEQLADEALRKLSAP